MDDNLRLRKIEDQLLHKRINLELQIQDLENNDPTSESLAPEASELGTDAWEADAHSRRVIAQHHLVNLLHQTKIALGKLKQGTYGSCERCGQKIHLDRLEAMPVAVACGVCANLIINNHSVPMKMLG